MNLPLHFLRKDLKFARFWILSTWLIAAMALLFPLVPVEKRPDFALWLLAFRFGSWILLFHTVAHVVLVDAPARDTAFFRTLPISPGQWLRSKLLCALTVILPMSLIQISLILILGLRPGASGFFLLFAEDFLSHAVVASLALGLAARKSNHARFYASVMIWVAVAIFGVFLYSTIHDQLRNDRKVDWSYSVQYLKMSRAIVAQAVAFAGLLIGMIVFTRSRRRYLLDIVLVMTVVISISAGFFWPVNFVESLAAPEATAPRDEWPDQDAIEFEFVERKRGPSEKSMFSTGDSGYNGTTYRRIEASSRLSGLPAGWFAFPNGYESDLTLSDGKTIHSGSIANGSLGEEMILPSLGIPSPYNFRSEGDTSGVFIAEFRLEDAQHAKDGAKISGEVNIPLKRPVILATLPLKAGASAVVGDKRFRVVSVEQTGEEFNYTVVAEHPLIASRGGYYSSPYRRIQFIVINPERKEYLDYGGGASGSTSSGFYGVQYWRESGTIWKNWRAEDKGDPDTKGWLEGARLFIISEESGGILTEKFDFKEVSLRDGRGN